ncbi:MAG TPA: OsmC family protein [Bacteroidales bacterium]|nr:OsmC family protein [Bacteroidales bacterium]
MKDTLDVKWAGDMAFEATVDGHNLILDASPSVGGHKAGPRPKPLLMVSIAGCTGMDVVSILKKMKVELAAFNVHVEGTLTEEHPKYFTAIHLVYEFTGENIPFDKVKHAIELSQEKYCGVSATLRKALPVTYEIIIKTS